MAICLHTYMHSHVMQVGHAGADYGSMGHLSGSQLMCLIVSTHSRRASASSTQSMFQVQFEARVWDRVLLGWSHCAELLQLHRTAFWVRFRIELRNCQSEAITKKNKQSMPSTRNVARVTGEFAHMCCVDAVKKTCARSTMKSSPSSLITPPPGTGSG